MTKSHSISRRSALTALGTGGIGLALAPTAIQVASQDASPESIARHPIVGTWILQFEPGPGAPVTPVVTVFGADGSFFDAASGHAGVWEVSGVTSVLHTWVHVFPQANNYVVVSGSIEIDGEAESWTQAYSSMVVAADGSVLNAGGGNVQARRLHPVPVDQMGTPLEVVPVWTPVIATPT